MNRRTPLSSFSSSRIFRNALAATVAVAGVITTSHSFAAAQLVVAPTRVVLEGRERTASINLINRGDETGTFRVSFERKRMTESGDIVKIENPAPGEVYADQMIRFTPRQVTLAPGQQQVVRLLLRKPSNLADGEYRSHMLFQAIPPDKAKSIQSQATSRDNKLTIEIIPVLGISIPVIVRHGVLDAKVSLEGLRLENQSKDGKKALLVLTAKRSGNRSVYGDFIAYFTPASGGEKLTVAKINGVAIYTPNASRLIKLPLQSPDNVKLENGVIEVVYRTSGAEGEAALATATARIAASQ